MGIEVFNRYEKKFLIDYSKYQELQERMTKHLEMDAFNKENGFYTISNIYYDTIQDELIQKSIAKPIYKEKLRLRAYGVPESSSKGYLEIKKKFKGLVNKRRTSMTVQDAVNFVATGVKPDYKPYYNQQVINEIDFFLRRYELKPAIYIAYDRTAFFSKESHDLRITFDQNIRTRKHHLSLEAGDHGNLLMDQNLRLMEIKAEKAFPLWLTSLLSEMKIYPTSFSKYGEAYTNNIKEHLLLKGEKKLCLNPYSLQQQQPLFL